MEKYFECFNCKGLLGTVYESKCCGVLYCENCKSKLSNTQCLKCNKLLEFQKNIFAQRLLKNINIKCKYNCGKTLPYDKMKQHLLICDKKIYICSFDNIDNKDPNKQPFKGNKKEILDHLVKNHSHILLLFMENHQNFEPILKNIIKKNGFINNNNNKEDSILDLTDGGNLNLDFLGNSESGNNTSNEFDQDIQLLNGINDLNLINSNIQNFNDLQLNNRRNNHNNNHHNNNNINLNNRINSLNSENSDNNIGNNNISNNINLLDVDLSRNNYQPLRDLRFTSFLNDNENNNLSLEYRSNINNNSEYNINNINNINSGNRRRDLLNYNQNNINNNFINNGSNNINNQY